MYSFRNDYSEGAHPKVLQRLVDTNLTQTCGYALDPLSETARETVRRVCQAPEADVLMALNDPSAFGGLAAIKGGGRGLRPTGDAEKRCRLPSGRSTSF